MNAKTPSYREYRFPPEVISHAVWLYYRFCLSFRDVEDLLAKRGVIVSYETIRQWSRKFGAQYARKLKLSLVKTPSALKWVAGEARSLGPSSLPARLAAGNESTL